MSGPIAAEPIVLTCIVDSGYALPLAATIRSAVESLAVGRTILLYVLDDGLDETLRERLLSSWHPARVAVRWVPVDRLPLQGLPLWGRMSPAVYCRLLLPQLLPSSLSKVICLDSDLIVLRDLGELWRLEVGDRGVLAAQDMVVPYASSRFGIARHAELGIAAHVKLFNSGVMVVNLDWWRRHDVSARALGYLRQRGTAVTLWDQEALNAVLIDRWGELDPRWNQIASVSGHRFFQPEHLDASTYRLVVEDPWIVHFAGTWKPWRCHDGTPASALFFRYLDQTAWAGWRPPRTIGSTLMATYRHRVRPVVYPLERWGLELWRRARRRIVHG